MHYILISLYLASFDIYPDTTHLLTNSHQHNLIKVKLVPAIFLLILVSLAYSFDSFFFCISSVKT